VHHRRHAVWRLSYFFNLKILQNILAFEDIVRPIGMPSISHIMIESWYISKHNKHVQYFKPTQCWRSLKLSDTQNVHYRIFQGAMAAGETGGGIKRLWSGSMTQVQLALPACLFINTNHEPWCVTLPLSLASFPRRCLGRWSYSWHWVWATCTSPGCLPTGKGRKL
jgi:hypothetical protein